MILYFTPGVTVSLRGLSVVDDKVAWASGVNGTVIRTIDGGQTWTELPKIQCRHFDRLICDPGELGLRGFSKLG